MKLSFLFTFICALNSINCEQKCSAIESQCERQEQLEYYRKSITDFALNLVKQAGVHSGFHFLFSPLPIWLAISAITEGTQGVYQEDFFQKLNLPTDAELRRQFYNIASSRYLPNADVNIQNTLTLIVDKNLVLNRTWFDYVEKNTLLDIGLAAIKDDPIATAEDAKIFMSSALNRLDLSGNSFLLDSIDYSALWTAAFSDAIVERAPFYDGQGQEIGAVDLMRLRRHVRLGYVPQLDLKYIELPLGADERYRMIFAIFLDQTTLAKGLLVNTTNVFEIFKGLEWSDKPLDVAIPRFTMTSELDVKVLLNGMGFEKLWTDPEATNSLSNPPALPSAYIQRATITLNNAGVEPSPPIQGSLRSGKRLDLSKEKDFVANRPFMLGLFDVETRTCLMASMYSQPTYPKNQ